MIQNVERTDVYAVLEAIEEEKMAHAASKNEEKGKLQMDLVIETLCNPRNTRPLWKMLYR